MDKDKRVQKKQKNIIYLLTLLVILTLFVVSAFIDEIFGMIMFGVLTFYVIIGGSNYKVEQKPYEEMIQSKRELLNYDKLVANKDNEEN